MCDAPCLFPAAASPQFVVKTEKSKTGLQFCQPVNQQTHVMAHCILPVAASFFSTTHWLVHLNIIIYETKTGSFKYMGVKINSVKLWFSILPVKTAACQQVGILFGFKYALMVSVEGFMCKYVVVYSLCLTWVAFILLRLVALYCLNCLTNVRTLKI